uniref:CSON000730 protein n=1 Tax=Culicoides sonorensis TaxID=179676 RepID=A0A336LQ25_CULSO
MGRRSPDSPEMPDYNNGKMEKYRESRHRSPKSPSPVKKHYERSYSPPPPKRRARRSRSYDSPDRRRGRKHQHENPPPSRCVGIFGMNIYTRESQIRDLFSKFGSIRRVNMITCNQTGRSRGFCFVYYQNIEDAITAKEQTNGIELDDRRIRVDFSITDRAHTPTPGTYMGSRYDSRCASPSNIISKK